MANLPSLPKDLSAAQRATTRLISHIAIIVLFNAAIAALVIVESFRGGAIDWTLLATSVASQAALALADTMRKYYSAKNEPALSSFFELAKLEVQTVAPAVQYSSNEQSLINAFSGIVLPEASQAGPLPTSAAPATTPDIALDTTQPKLAAV